MACACVSFLIIYLIFIHYFRQIVNCLNEWELGYEVKIAFSGDRYESVHQAFMDLIDELESNEYHGAKLRALLKRIATDSRSVIIIFCIMLLIPVVRLQNIKRRGNSKAHGFKIVLD
jgi:hypothetical protein